jgi:flagellar basal body-associated protein FliL
MSTTTTEADPDNTADAAKADRPAWRTVVIVLAVAVVLLAGAATAFALSHSGPGHRSTTMPHSAAMEAQLGIRVSRVVVVADGGLLTVSYVVLDGEKAQRFQADLAHPPVLTSESRPMSTKRVSLMKQGHALRAGQTYYLVYENTRGAIHAGEQVTIGYGHLRLHHVPVLK